MSAHLDVLRLEASALPQAPGVYFWKDENDRTLYIGKAVNLRVRVASYFSNARHNRRTRELLGRSRHIAFELTETELQALFRESALIKREQPEYNRVLRLSRRHFYLKLDGANPDPYLEVASELESDGSLYFGPFPSSALARETLAYLHAVLPLRKCAAARPRCRPCIYFQMHTCAAPLIDDQHRRRHEEAINRLRDLLDGRNDRVAEWLQKKRNRLSESLLFEQAAEIQLRIDALHDHHRQHSVMEAAIQCRCVLVHDVGRDYSARALLVAHGHVLSVRELAGLGARDVAQWVRLHEAVIGAAQREQNELDSASVLERWLHSRGQQTRWVAIPHRAREEDLLDRVRYVLDR